LARSSRRADQVIILSSRVSRETSRNVEQFEAGIGRIDSFDWRTGKRVFEPVPAPAEPRAAAFSPDGRMLAVLCAGGQLLGMDADSGQVLVHVAAGEKNKFHNDYVSNGALRFSPDGRSLLTWGTDSTLRVWDLSAGALRYSIPQDRPFHDAACSADGKLLATAAWDNTARVWDLTTGQPVSAPLPHPDWVFTVQFGSSPSAALSAGSGERDDPEGHGHTAYSAEGEQRPDDPTHAAAAGLDREYLLTACRDGMARLWNWRTARLACPPFQHSGEVFGVAICDGRRILTTSLDGTARLWEWHTGKPLTPPLVLDAGALHVTISPNGRYAAVGGVMDGLRLIDLAALDQPPSLGVKELHLWAEVLSGQRIQEGGDVTNLTADEWLQRWRQLRARR
jgi:WD40 repeat protein